ncbi:MAG TPA: hypothetical protein PLB25_21225, partial [Rhodoferax sp.]|nr:hypothetical protein [Rhodoferax sp.]
MVTTALRKPCRALLLMTNSILGPGVAETTNVIATNNHHVLKLMCGLSGYKRDTNTDFLIRMRKTT